MFQLAIPSLGRSKTIMNQTLKCLESLKEQITVFVIEEEYDDYRAVLPEHIDVVIGVKGIIEQRKFIHHYYEEGTNLVSIDDDITEIDCEDLHKFITQAFSDLVEHDAFLWGVYPVYNKFFRENKQHLSTGLSFIIGSFYGVRIRHDDDLETTVSTGEKEDTERTLRYFIKDGCVLRYNQVGIKTKFFAANGGMGNFKERSTKVNEDADRIDSAFGIYGKIQQRKNGIKEFKLQAIPRRLKTDVVTELEPLPESMFEELFNMLQKISIPIIYDKTKPDGTARRGFSTHRAAPLGLVRQRLTGLVAESRFSRIHPKIHDEIFRIGKLICPFEFTSVHLNHNVVCPPHVDNKNAGVSCLVSFGKYKGGEIVVNGNQYNACFKPLIFNGTVLPHWNNPLEEGSQKYSLVFYNSGTCDLE